MATRALSDRRDEHDPGSHETRAVLFDLDRTLIGQDKVTFSWIVAFVQFYLLGPLARSHGATLPRRAVTWLARALETGLRRHVRLDEAAQRVLAAVRQAGLPFGVVSNGRRHRRETIRALGLETMTDCIFISREIGRHKPERDIFLDAAACLGVPAAQVLFVGDKPRADIQGARTAGMKTAWVCRGRRWPAHKAGAEPDLTLDSLDALIELLQLRAIPNS